MATLPSTPRTSETPVGTVVGIGISLAAVVFLVLVYFHHSWTKRTGPRACLIYEESTSESDTENKAWRRERGRRGNGGRDRHRRGREDIRGSGGGVWQALKPRWWRRGKHPHAYCKRCEARKERVRAAGLRDMESGEKVRRPQPTYAPPYATKDYTRQWAQSHGGGDGERFAPDWRGGQCSAAEQWRQPQQQWKRAGHAGYGMNRGPAKMSNSIWGHDGGGQRGQRDATRSGN